MSSSWGSLWPGLPASANVIQSNDVYVSDTTPLTVIGGGSQQPSTLVPPSSAPSTPKDVFITNQQIIIQFDTTGITGTLPLTYYALYGTTANPTTAVSTTATDPTTQQAIINSLTPLTNYYFASGVQNVAGTLSSGVLGPIQTEGAPNAPTIPVLVTATNTTITASTDASAVVGVPTPTILMTYIQTPGGSAVQVSTINTSGSIWSVQVSSLTANTNYGFSAQASNVYGSSGTDSAIFSTLA